LNSSCNKDDNTNPDEVACEKDENYFTASFDENTLEPYWQTGTPGGSNYTLIVNRNSSNKNNWRITVRVQEPNIDLIVILKNIENVGEYDIETGSIDFLPIAFYNNTYITIFDLNLVETDLFAGYTHFSLEETGGIQITEYDSDRGVLVGTFSCRLYSTEDENDVKEISGEFNINMQTYDNRTRPCWL
jgi:hypothetical protein